VQARHDGVTRLLAAILRPVLPYCLWRPLLRDPDEEMVLDAAVNGQAEAIGTCNVQDFLPGARQFHLEVLTPAEALQRLRRQ
jgi:predicted nucleic acid-binding protein